MDSIKTLDSPTTHRLHGTISGKLYKGHTIIPHNSTIPTKYQTVVIDNSDHKGFNSQSRRFQYEMTEGVNPSPVAYMGTADSSGQTKPSYSKKGTGGFASMTKRTWKTDTGCSPGPNRYVLPSHLQSRKDFAHSVGANFQHDIAVKREKLTVGPGPCKYNLFGKTGPHGKENHVAAAAAFKSRTKRELMDLHEAKRLPGPTHYNIETADKILASGEKVPMSSFKSTSKRDLLGTPELFPGPGEYAVGEPYKDDAKRQLFPMKHYLCLSAPALPLPPTPPGPGPGQYEMAAAAVPRQFMSGAAFVSNTSRWGGPGYHMGPQGDAACIPGPAQYHPTKSVRQSFLYNASGKWI